METVLLGVIRLAKDTGESVISSPSKNVNVNLYHVIIGERR
jgi:hypothetical protein